MKKIICALTALIMAFSFSGCSIISAALKPNVKCEEVCPRVFDLGTYTELDYDLAEGMIEKSMNIRKGGCSAVIKTLDNGDIAVGRNLDLYICNYPVYVLHTKIDGMYETMGSVMMYDSPFKEYDKVSKKGVSNIAYQLLPFLVMDVMNSEGLYMQVNMRQGETNENGKGLFISSGTNPDGEHRVLATSTLQYIASNCATIDEALKYIETLDIYSDPAEDSWGYGFLLADATGRHGILEIAKNNIYWTEGQNYHTNFYIADEVNKAHQYQTGVGRYEAIEEGYDGVHTEEDLAQLLDFVSYRQVLSDNCRFDRRSEFTGGLPGWTYEYVINPDNESQIMEKAAEETEKVKSTPREEMTVEDDIWETTYRNIANISQRTMTYRFFENDEYTFTLEFSESAVKNPELAA